MSPRDDVADQKERNRREALSADMQVTLDLAESEGARVYVSGFNRARAVLVTGERFSDALVLRLWHHGFRLSFDEAEDDPASAIKEFRLPRALDP